LFLHPNIASLQTKQQIPTALPVVSLGLLDIFIFEIYSSLLKLNLKLSVIGKLSRFGLSRSGPLVYLLLKTIKLFGFPFLSLF
jgi:hypothetical protein